MAASAAVTLLPLTATGYEPGGRLTLQQLTATGAVTGGGGSMRQLTATGVGQNWDAQGAGTFGPHTGAGIGSNPNVATAAVTLKALTGRAFTPVTGSLILQPLTAIARSDSGQRASAAVTLLAPTASAAGVAVGSAFGTAVIQRLTALGRAVGGTNATAALVLRQLQAAASGIGGQVGAAAVSLKALTASVTAYSPSGASGVILVPRHVAYAQGETGLAAQLDTFAMNTRTNDVTRYPSYPANSFARYNGTYLGAGPNGLFLLAGGSDTDLGGGGIDWVIRTGQLDDKFAGLKRLTEVLLGCRYDGPVRMRIWKDDQTYYDYSLPNLRPSTLQQVRVKAGKGVRSRYYKIELSATGTRFELDSLQATMPELTRRVG